MKISTKFLFIPVFLFLSSFAFPDGFIIVNPQTSVSMTDPFPLEVRYHYVDVAVKDQLAETRVDQIFYNPGSSNLEGTYIFPVPKGSAIKKFSMMINGNEVQAEFLDAKKARTVYEDIVRKLKDPAILEYSGEDMFSVRVFPIEPHSEKRITIYYDEVLNKDNGTYEYTYPLNTEKFSSKPLAEVRVNVKLESGDALSNIYCTTHNAEINRIDRNRATLSYTEKNTRPESDFTMYFNTSGSDIGISCLTYREPGEEYGYFLMNLNPSYVIKRSDIEAKDITFVLDTSGSMAEGKLDQAKKALLFCLTNLNENDGFDIIRFSTEAESLFGKMHNPDDANLKKAKAFVNGLKPTGGTNIEEALSLALKSGSSGSRPSMIIFITDGKPTIGETEEDKLLKIINDANMLKTRIFTFGIGYDINTHLLDKMTEATRSYRSYIAPDEDIEIKISNFYMKVQSPVLTDLKLTFDNNFIAAKIYPKDLPDLFKGSSLNVLGMYKGKGKIKISLDGIMNKIAQKYQYEMNVPEDNGRNAIIASLWAARRIGYLLDQVRLHGEDRELTDEITMLAKKFGIITPYTSYLIIEDERKLTSQNIIREKDQIFSNNVKKQIEDKTKSEFNGMKDKSGETSIRSSREIQSLNDSKNIQETKQGESRMNYRDNAGNEKNLASQIRNINGRAVYQVEGTWIDSLIQKNTKLKVNVIRFASDEYFKLLLEKPETSGFLALGKNIRFVLDNRIYEIQE
jgi:Ca-activated chloride channel homolog